MYVHVPVPCVGVLPTMVAVVPQTVWLAGAWAMVGRATRVIATTETLFGHELLERIVQENKYVPGWVIPAIEPKVPKVVMVAGTGPEMKSHLPVAPCGTWLPVTSADCDSQTV